MNIRSSGQLTDDDRALTTDGSPYDVYRFVGVEGSTIRIVLGSEEFEPYVLVFGPDNSAVISTNGFGTGQIDVSFPVSVSGPYSVFVNTSFTAEECVERGCSATGRYGLLIEEH